MGTKNESLFPEIHALNESTVSQAKWEADTFLHCNKLQILCSWRSQLEYWNKINYATSIWTQKKEEIFWKQNIEGTTRGTQYRFASWKVRSPNHSLASCRKELLGWASVAWGCLSSEDHSFLPSQSMWFASPLLSHPVKDEQVSKANTKEHQLLAIEVDG